MRQWSLHGWLVGLLALIAAGCAGPSRVWLDHGAIVQPAIAPVGASSTTVGTSPLQEYTLHVPPNAGPGRPLTVLLALHGMGDNGASFSRALIEDAARHGWLLVAPTMSYSDWRDPEQVRSDGASLLPSLKALLDELPDRTGLPLNKRVLIYGFSRGGQSAHRFALFYPEYVARVATFSCGTYTLPSTRVRESATEQPLKFPYGVGDIAQYQGRGFDPDAVREVDFWLGVGGRDNATADVPRQWDTYLGTNRVERARSFSRALEQLGADTHLTVFPDAAHEITDTMRGEAIAFLTQIPDS